MIAAKAISQQFQQDDTWLLKHHGTLEANFYIKSIKVTEIRFFFNVLNAVVQLLNMLQQTDFECH